MELCSIASGSSGNCICVGTEDAHLLIDAGISGKRIETGLNSIGLKTSEMEAILITHEHIDHIAGLGVLARRYGLPIYGTQGTLDAIRGVKSVGKIEESLLHPILPGEAFQVRDMTVHPISISHDAADPVAYLLQMDSHKIGVITDLGTYNDDLVEQLQHLDVLLLEANHDVRMLQTGSYPYQLKQRILSDRGHLSNVLSGQLLGRLLHDRFGSVVLGHLSQENNFAELAYETVRLEVSMGENPYKGDDFPIYVAKRSEASQMVCA